MLPYKELNAHHIGKSHVQNSLSCEDYSASYSDEDVSIVVISDGHGDKNCFRSAKGAEYACKTAISLCQQFQKITNHINDIEQCDFESLIISLESDIADTWKEKVFSDIEAHPFSEEELLIASEQAQEAYRNGQRLEKAYGCTLILAMSTANYWLSIQIGDGKSIAAYADGVFVEPVPTDENCLGNRSTSLCNSNAKELFRHYYSKIKPIAAFVSSDGIEESFDQAGLYNLFYSIAYWLKEEGYDITKSKLEELLPQISDGGSGDDVSVAFMVSMEDTIAKPRQTLEQIYERVNACNNSLIQCKNLLEDTNEQILEKNNAISAIEKDIVRLKEELEEKEKVSKQIRDEQALLQKKADELSIKTERTSEQMIKATKFKASAERYWFAEFDRLGLVYQPIIDDRKAEDVQNGKEESKEEASETKTTISNTSNEEEQTILHQSETATEIGQTDSTEEEKGLESEDEQQATPATTEAEVKDLPTAETKSKLTSHFWPFAKKNTIKEG